MLDTDMQQSVMAKQDSSLYTKERAVVYCILARKAVYGACMV